MLSHWPTVGTMQTYSKNQRAVSVRDEVDGIV